MPADTSYWAGLMHSQCYLYSCAPGLALAVFLNCVKCLNYKWCNPVHSLSYKINPTHINKQTKNRTPLDPQQHEQEFGLTILL